MIPEFNTEKSIYIQIAESIEDDILQNIIEEETQAPSTNQLAVMYRINPATAAKGINLLVDAGILYKKRGIGMFVSHGSAERIRTKRSATFLSLSTSAVCRLPLPAFLSIPLLFNIRTHAK